MAEPLVELMKAYAEWSGEACRDAIPLPVSGSERRYWRLKGERSSAIGTWHPILEENRAFLELTRHFVSRGLDVPEIYFSSLEKGIYLQQDLGDTTLFSLLQSSPQSVSDPEVMRLYKRALEELLRFQHAGDQGLDYSVCYPRSSFDMQSIMWDLNYFKYNFLKLETGFNEDKLEEDLRRLAAFLLDAPAEHFMYRDFQARNIMVKDDRLYFIDYQGGRKGPLQYDPVSLLFQVKADLAPAMREELLDHYLSGLEKSTGIGKSSFMRHYDGFILLRLLQVLGAYGFRGLIQRKPHFVTSLPYAMKNVRWFLQNSRLPLALPELFRCLDQVSHSEKFDIQEDNAREGLTVVIRSFSYKNGIPEDREGHGGGFIFDCRSLPNPGREASMRSFNGRNPVIREYLLARQEVARFLDNVYSIMEQAVENYLDRRFGSLSAAFGCTGGQHRSVYCAEALAAHLRNKYPGITVKTTHRELSAHQNPDE